MVQLRIRGLRKVYEQTAAVEGFDLDVAEREFVSLVGPSGCGKTTILRMIAGLIEPDAGSIELAGQDITAMAVHKRKLGLVFQSYALFPHLTVYENVAFGLRRQRLAEPEVRKRVTVGLDMVRLSALSQRLPKQLSGGQQQRVALARALVTQPRLLLLDEPLSNLDALLRDEMRLELKRLQNELGVTTLFVTHDQSEALAMSDRIVVLNKGRLEQVGPPEEVYDSPASAFVASFVGRSNFLAGTVVHHTDEEVLVRCDGVLDVAVCNSRVRIASRRLDQSQLVHVVLRHERIHIERTPTSGRRNSFPGRIVVRAFAGSSSQYVVRLDSGPELQVEVPRDSAAIADGSPVFVEWDHRDALVLASDGAT